MSKISKKIAKIFGSIGLVLLGLVILLLLALNSSLLQTKLLNNWLAQQSQTTGIVARVQQVDVGLFSRYVRISGVEIYDHHQNLLFDAGTLQTTVRNFSTSHLTLGTTHIFDVTFQLHRYEEDSISNLQHFLSFFDTSRDTNTPKFTFKTSAVFLKNGNFSYIDDVYSKGDTFRFIDFQNVSLTELNLSARNVDIVGDNVLATIENLTFKEQKGFEVWKFSTRLNLSSEGIVARKTEIVTSQSDLDLDVKFTTQSWEDYKNFISKVRIYAKFRNTNLDFKDLVYFAQGLEGKYNQFRISGSILGYVNNFRAKDFDVSYGRNTRFFGNVLMSGLPKFDTTFFDVSIKNFTTIPEDIDDFLLPKFNKITIPEELYQLGKTSLSGHIIGFTSDLRAFLDVNSAMGYIQTELNFSHDKSNETFDFSGDIEQSKLAVGHFFDEKNLGNNLNLNGRFEGQFSTKNGMDFRTDMVCKNVEFHNRNINTISIKGDWLNQLISATVSMDDDDGTAEFSGELSFDPKNSYLDVNGFFKDVDLLAFQLLNDTNQPLLSSKFSGKIYNFNIDSLIGTASLSDLHLKLKDTAFHLEKFSVSQQMLSQGTSTKIDCDFFKADILGSYNFSNINDIWNDIQTNYLSALKLHSETFDPLFHSYQKYHGNTQKHSEFQSLGLTLDVHKTDGLFSYFLPEIDLPQGANIVFDYNGKSQPLALKVATENATVHGFQLSYLDFNGTTQDSIFEISMGAKNLYINHTHYLEDFSIAAKFESDVVLWKFDWVGMSNENRNRQFNGKFDGRMNVLDSNKMSFDIQNSELFLSGQFWQFDSNSMIIANPSGVSFENVRFYNQNDLSEYLSLNGELSRATNSALNLTFNRYQLQPWIPIIERIGMTFDGAISGQVDIFDFFNNLRFNTNLRIEDFSINQFNYGTAFLQTTANEKLAESRINFDIRNNGKNYLSAKGLFCPNRKEQNFDIKATVSDLDLSLLKNYVNTFSSSLIGTFGGELTLDGPLNKPNFYGHLTLDNTIVKIDFLNTYYAIKPEKIAFSLDSIIFVNARLEDVQNKTQGTLFGGLHHHRFQNFQLDLGLQMNNFLALNTTRFQNETFFGKAFITGNAHLGGAVENMRIDVQGRTERGTELQVNHSSRANISETYQFIHFTVPQQDMHTDTISNESRIEIYPANMTVKLNIDVTPDASIFFDMDAPPISGMINAQGSGNLQMNFESRTQQFTMFGDYVLQDGFYDFSFEGGQFGSLITRRFLIERGGTIQWTGDPGNMILDLSAIYSTRASLTPVLSHLTAENNSNTMRRVNVQSVISIDGRMPQPNIRFDFRLPNVDDDIRTQFFSVVNRDDANEMSQQTFSLLLFGGFTTPGDNSNIIVGANNPTSMAWDMAFNQINSILQNMTGDNINFGVNYRPADLYHTSQTQFTLSTQFFDNRLLIDGHLGQGGMAVKSATQQAIMGEFNAEWRWTNRLSLKAFSRPNEREFLHTSQLQLGYLQGAGITYRREFDSFRSLFSRRKEE